MVGDSDGDDVTIEVEAVRAGQAFSGFPTHSVTAPVGVDRADHCGSAYDRFHACIEVKLTGLAAGQRYSLAARVRDAFGAAAVWLGYNETDGGWVELGSFALQP